MMMFDEPPPSGMAVAAPEDAPGVRMRDARLIAAIITFSWLFYLMTKVLLAIAQRQDPIVHMPGRLVIAGVGMTLSYGMYLALLRSMKRSIAANSLLVVGYTFVASALFAILNTWMIDTFSEPVSDFLMHTTIAWAASVHIFFAQAIAMVAVLYAVQLRDKEEHAVDVQKHLRRAELRALRYQVNPHFLFNALNSVSALIWANRPSEADRMVGQLANYYETALTSDDRELVPLSREIETQFQYLEIERIRFEERLTVKIECPDRLRNALVPNLIIQPLVENSIKHGVALSASEVGIGIVVSEKGGRLMIVVSDSGRSGTRRRTTRRAGVGLKNTEARLHSFFGPKASLHVEARPDGFESRIELPLRLA